MSKTLPTCYAVYYRKMADRARDLGYAVTLHGSLLRDADMVAIPWTDKAVDPNELAEAMLEVVQIEAQDERNHGAESDHGGERCEFDGYPLQ